ncbi:unnamed protein product [Miscanthus lutarioriparius]|uniref:CRM domain-containing protein n=1 Tax=Miscanthus lutarioriparius TaxID=422564 RepID=A0A811QXD6_9POAL|nr:unnamed protein product [Miscanthus lutarioriparius]
MCGSSSSSPAASFERLWGWFGQDVHGRRWRPWFQQPVRRGSTAITLDTDGKFARFGVGNTGVAKQKGRQQLPPKKKMSRKAKVNQLKWYRLKAKKKMKSPNPEVRIRYKLEKAKRKEEWLIEKLRKYEVPRTPEPVHDPEILTEEEKFYLKRTGEKKKNYVPVGRRGVFGGVVLNMHLHWKNHETVKVVCKPCRPGQVYEYAEELTRLSKGTVIDIKPNNTIIFYRGKNYVQPKVMSPPDTLSKQKALEKYRYLQSLEHTSQFIEKLEKELEDYKKHVALFKNRTGKMGMCRTIMALRIGLIEKRVSFPERPDMKSVVLKEQPFLLQSCLSSSIGWPVDFQKQKDSFVRDRAVVLRELHFASEHESCAGQQEILERESLPRAETSIHGIVTNIVRYDIEDEKLAPPKDDLMNHSRSNPAKRHMEGTDCHSPLPKKLKYLLKDEKLNC